MLLVHRYVYPDHPELETAEFTASLVALIVYVISRNSLKDRPWHRTARKSANREASRFSLVLP